jgi:hypothetical protein
MDVTLALNEVNEAACFILPLSLSGVSGDGDDYKNL